MASFGFSSMFGPSLTAQGGGTVPTDEALAGKVVGLYFSAHWCPPCRGFTPKLAEIYKAYQAKGLAFEILFVSSDRDESAFGEYFGEQPWLALPFAERDAKEALSKKFKVRGIPTLVILDADGSVITTDGREAVTEDPTGAAFPWKPKPLSELLAPSLVLDGQDGKSVSMGDLADKHLLLYFSAHWCPPCRGFTPKLAEHYKAYQTKGLPVECIFVSSDKDAASFGEYFGEMPWLALPFAERDTKGALSKAFDVSGIPSLVVLGPVVDGARAIVSKNARGAVGEDATGAGFPWAPKPIEDLAAGVECNGHDINAKPALVLLMESADDAEQAALKSALEELAVEIAADKADGEPPAIVFFAERPDGPVSKVRQLCGLPGMPPDEPTLLVLDIPDNGGFYVRAEGGAPLDAAAIREFYGAYRSGALAAERKQLGGGK